VAEVNGGERPGYVEGWGTWDGHTAATDWVFADAYGVPFTRAPVQGSPADPLILTGRRTALLAPATHAPRVWAPQQRTHRLDVSTAAAPFDPASLVDTRARLAAATHTRASWVRPAGVRPVPDQPVAADVTMGARQQPTTAPPSRPVQRPYASPPGLLEQLLELELLGDATTESRARTPVTHAPRTWAPVQPLRAASSPGLLDVPLLEVPLLRQTPPAAVNRVASQLVQPLLRSVPDEAAAALDPTTLTRAWPAAATHARPGWQAPTLRLPVPDQSPAEVPAPAPVVGWRRDVAQPQTRPAPVVGLSDAALLEGALLGGGETGKRVNVPASHTPRTWAPVQPEREASSPGLLDAALLESPLLGAATAGARVNVPATHVDRRQTVAPRPVQADQSTTVADYDPTLAPARPSVAAYARPGWTRTGLPVADQSTPASGFDPTTAGPGRPAAAAYVRPGWSRDRTQFVDQSTAAVFDPTQAGPRWPAMLAAWAADRRQQPPQRPAGADPAGTPDDPLTAAYGAGGPYWHLYNTAPQRPDKRTPQRAYLTDQGVLSAALLEPPLLGGQDDTARHREGLTGWRVRDITRPPMPGPPTAVDADPLLMLEQQRRRTLLPATHTPRPVLRWTRVALADVSTALGPAGYGVVTLERSRSTVTVDGPPAAVAADRGRSTVMLDGPASTVDRDRPRTTTEAGERG
jgi:hypothetical protein